MICSLKYKHANMNGIFCSACFVREGGQCLQHTKASQTKHALLLIPFMLACGFFLVDFMYYKLCVKKLNDKMTK